MVLSQAINSLSSFVLIGYVRCEDDDTRAVVAAYTSYITVLSSSRSLMILQPADPAPEGSAVNTASDKATVYLILKVSTTEQYSDITE